MDERQKIDLKQHALPPVSKKYLIKTVIYVILLVIVGALIYQVGFRLKPSKASIDDVDQIDNVTISPPPYQN
jgi:hypothetical protein